MRRCLWGSILIMVLLVFPAVSSAGLVKEVQLTQATGGYANYDSDTGTIEWTGGGGGWLLTDDYGVVDFDDSVITGTFSNVTDTSLDNLASALFATGSWSLEFSGSGSWLDPVFTISGHTINNYAETETGTDTNKLDGRAIVIVDDAEFTLGFFNDYFGIPVSMAWEGGIGTYAGMIADVTLPDETPGIVDYASDYTSTNLTVTLYADESIVPEPATITLFGVAGLLALRRRRRV